jgi:hypothetical protein
MLKTKLGQTEAAALSRLLQDISRVPGLDPSTQRTAGKWARATRPSMPRRDLQRMAWFLDDATLWAPLSQKDAISSWSAYIEGLI